MSIGKPIGSIERHTLAAPFGVMGVLTAVALLLGNLAAAHAGLIGTYVDAEGGTAGNTINTTTLSHTDWYDADLSGNPTINHGTDTDNLWRTRVDGTFAAEQLPGTDAVHDIWESAAGNSENAPEITTTISGLAPGMPYEVYVVYDAQGTWTTRAGLAGHTLTSWTTANGLSTGVGVGAIDEFEGDLGSASASGTGTIGVNVDDLVTIIGGDFRPWYDGVAFVELPEPASLSLLGVGALLLVRRRR